LARFSIWVSSRDSVGWYFAPRRHLAMASRDMRGWREGCGCRVLRRHQTLSAHTSDAPRTNVTSGIPNGDLTRALQAGSPSQLLAARLDDVGRSPEITRGALGDRSRHVRIRALHAIALEQPSRWSSPILSASASTRTGPTPSRKYRASARRAVGRARQAFRITSSGR